MAGSSSEASRRRRKENDRDPTKRRERPNTHDRSSKTSARSSKKTSSKEKDKDRHRDSYRDRDSDRPRRSTSTHSSEPPLSKEAVPELNRRSSLTAGSDSRASTSYPSYSKAHSREVIGSRENIITPGISPCLSNPTPDPTIMESEAHMKNSKPTQATFGAPPSPPLTAQDPDLRRSKSGHSMRTATNSPP